LVSLAADDGAVDELVMSMVMGGGKDDGLAWFSRYSRAKKEKNACY